MLHPLPAERWATIETLFLAAADLNPAERPAFLDARCGTDTELKEELLSLLRYDTTGPTEIEAAIGAEAALLVAGGTLPGSTLGAYRIERELGRGGMSVVYLAARDDGEFRKLVAVKLIKRGMDTDAVIERLRRERRILAGLEHPYIARLLDGGTTSDGRPYIVMEYVEGQAIDQYCNGQALSVRERCQLIEKVCEAVAYAHRHLVLHRDLKPANILITVDGNPRLLDFGVARVLGGDELDGASPETRGLSTAFTPEYASPEQLAGIVSGTGADVYSLGVVLYELLAGARPYGRDNASCAGDPDSVSITAARAGFPRRWSNRLEGDLDNILHKALHKDPQRRYLSVEQFQLDLFRHRNGLPVMARKDSLWYRSGKFLGRHRFGSVAAAAAAVAIALGIAATLWQTHAVQEQKVVAERRRVEADHERLRAEEQSRQSAAARLRAEAEHAEADRQRAQAELQKSVAETERAVADRRFDQVRELARKFTNDFYDAIAQLPGSTPARKMLVETGLHYYDSLAKDAQGNRDLLEEVARGYDKMGDVQGNPYYANLGDLAGASVSYKKALRIRNGIVDPSPDFLAARLQGHVRMAQALIAQADYKSSESYLREAAAFGETGVRNPAAAASWGVRNGLANVYSTLGDLKLRTGQDRDAIEPYSKQLEIRLALASVSDRVPGQAGISVSQTKLGDAWARSGHPIEGLEHLRPALEIDRKLAEENPRNMGLLRKLYVSNLLVAEALATPLAIKSAKPGEIRQYFEAAIAIAEKISAADPENRQPLLDIVQSGESYGEFLRGQKDPQAAVAQGRRSLAALEKLNKISPEEAGNVGISIEVWQRLAGSLALAGQFEEANQRLRSAEEIISRTDRAASGAGIKPKNRGEFLQSKGDVLAAQMRWAEAGAAYQEAIAIFEREFEKANDNRYWIDALPDLYVRLAGCREKSGERKAAIEALRKALDRFREIESKRVLTADESKSRDENAALLAAWENS